MKVSTGAFLMIACSSIELALFLTMNLCGRFGKAVEMLRRQQSNLASQLTHSKMAHT